MKITKYSSHLNFVGLLSFHNLSDSKLLAVIINHSTPNIIYFI